MGRPRIKTIDDSQIESEVKSLSRAKSRDQKLKVKNKEEQTKVETASSDVIASEATPEAGEATPEAGEATPKAGEAKQSSTNVEDLSRAESRDRHVADAPRDDKTKKSQKPGKAKPRSKKYREVAKDLDRTKSYPLTEAIDMVKKLSYSKFDATLEAHINTEQTGIRGLVSLPFASGRQLRILAFGKGTDTPSSVILNGAKRSEESLALASRSHAKGGRSENASLKQVERSFANAQDDTIRVGNDETIEQINKGKIDFDLVITTPDWMPKLTKVARILGPRGLMPNPKNGTITQDLKKTVEGFQAGKTEYKTEAKAPVIHLAMGKLNQPTEELSANVKTLLQTLGKTRVKKVTLSPTMGPAVKLDLSSL